MAAETWVAKKSVLTAITATLTKLSKIRVHEYFHCNFQNHPQLVI